MKIKKDFVEKDIKKVSISIKKIPTIKQYIQYGKYSKNTVSNIYGSWNKALIEIFGKTNRCQSQTLEKKQCLNCESFFKQKNISQKYCSRSCAAKINNLIPKRKKKIKVCKSCEENISGRNIYCEKCSINFKEKLLNTPISEFLKRKNNSNRFVDIRGSAKTIMKLENKICKNCGYSKHVEVCHIKDISSFSPETLVKEVNCKSNLVLLCPNCHWEFDNGRLKI